MFDRHDCPDSQKPIGRIEQVVVQIRQTSDEDRCTNMQLALIEVAPYSTEALQTRCTYTRRPHTHKRVVTTPGTVLVQNGLAKLILEEEVLDIRENFINLLTAQRG